MGIVEQIFPGLSSFGVEGPVIAIGRIALIIFGFILAYLGFKRTLEPLIMVPMGIGMMSVNGAVLFFGNSMGTLFLNPLVSSPNDLVHILQVDFLQPIYNFTFSNGLIACLIFMGIGAISDVGFVLMRPWASIIVALFAEFGTFSTLVIAHLMGLSAGQAASVGIIGGADGPMVLFTSLMLAPKLFVPISIIAYLYLSLTYAGYPYIIKALVPKKYRGLDMKDQTANVSKKSKFIFILVTCGVLCLLLPVAAPLIMSFFLGAAVREAEIVPFQQILEGPVMYISTMFLGLLLGVLCNANTILNPQVALLVFLGIVALFLSGVGGLVGGWFMYWVSKKKYNPVLGIAGVSCVPTTAKLAQKSAAEENPFAMILPLAMGANVSGLITTAIAAGVFISTISLVK